MTDSNDTQKKNTISLKKKQALTEGKQRNAPKDQTKSPNQPPPKPAKKEKEFKVLYRAKDAGKVEVNPLLSAFTEWKLLSEHHKLDQATHDVKTRENGNALMRSFEYKIIDKTGKEMPR